MTERKNILAHFGSISRGVFPCPSTDQKAWDICWAEVTQKVIEYMRNAMEFSMYCPNPINTIHKIMCKNEKEKL